MKKFVCNECGNEIIDRDSRKRNYCSYICYWNSLKKKSSWNAGLTKEIDARVRSKRKKDNFRYELISCKSCGKIFEALIAIHRKYCSKSCAARNKIMPEEAKNKIRLAQTGIPETPEAKESVRLGVLKKWCYDPEYARRVFSTRGKSRDEEKLYEMLEINFPGYWHYVGNGRIVIGGKVPDFVNEEDKKIIELYGDYYHKGQNPQDRINYFKIYGFNCIVIWVSEFKRDKNKVLDRVSEFA